MVDETNKQVETKDITFFEECVVNPNSRPTYNEFELGNEEAILTDPEQEDGDETDSVESDNRVDDRERQVRDIRDERYIDNGNDNDTQRCR